MSVIYLLHFDSNFHTGNFVIKTKITSEWADLQKELNNNNILKKTLKILKYNSLMKKTFKLLKPELSFEREIQQLCGNNFSINNFSINNLVTKLKKKEKQNTLICKYMKYLSQNPDTTLSQLNEKYNISRKQSIASNNPTHNPWYKSLVCHTPLGAIFTSTRDTAKISKTWKIVLKYYFK